MRPTKNKRRIDPRYFLEETVDKEELDEKKEHTHDDECGCPRSKKKKGKKDDDDREILFGEEDELEEQASSVEVGKTAARGLERVERD